MKKIILLILLMPMLASAQYFEVFDIDTSEYPIMKAKFYSIDANGKQILNHIPADFEITENGEPRDVISVSCPAPLDIPISVGIMVDTKNYINLARHGSERLVNLLNMPQNEVAITYMNQRPLIFQDFITSKTKAIEKSKTIPPAPGGTKVSEMFFDDFAGGVNIIKNRKAQNRVLIFISDLHCPNLSLDEQRLFQEAKDNKIRIYTVLIGTTDYTSLFGRIANETRGTLFEYVKDSIEIEDIFKKIAYREQNDPCEIAWNSNVNCKDRINLNIFNKTNSLFVKDNYSIIKDKIVNLELNPYFVNFGFQSEGSTKDTSIVVTARNKDLIINNITFEPNFGHFEVLNSLPIAIQKDQSLNLSIRYTAIDTTKQYSKLTLTTQYCDFNIGLLAGSISQPLTNRTLKLTHPNGGEEFIAGLDTIISWEGISKNDKVQLNFSCDNGKNWKTITNVLTGNVKKWRIPSIESDSCIVSVDQFDNNSTPNDFDIEWEKSYGGSSNDQAFSIAQTTDGGFIVTGRSVSVFGDITNPIQYYYFLIIKLKPNGELEWQKSYGGSDTDIPTSVIQSTDGGFVVSGITFSDDGDISNQKGNGDCWVIKLKSNGDIEWEKSYGGRQKDEAKSIIQSVDGGYVIAGVSESDDGDITNSYGLSDYWIVKLRPNGDIEWQKSYGGSDHDITSSIIQTYDDGFAVSGYSWSDDGDVTIGKGKNDYWIVKLSSNGELEWQKSYGGLEKDKPYSIYQTTDGGFIVAGSSKSQDGDITDPKGNEDYWIVKLSSIGELEWQKSYGGYSYDIANSVVQTTDGGFIVAGSSNSQDGDITDPKGSEDYWLVKLSSNGELEWEKSYGGTNTDAAYLIKQTFGGGYIVAGFSASIDGDITNHIGDKGMYDFWVMKLSPPPPPIQSDTSDAVFSIIMPEPVIQNNDIDMGQMIVGNTKDTIVSSVICNTGDAPLHVLGVDITDAYDSEDFLIPRGAGNFFLNKDECQDMMFEFTPTALGERTAVATIRTTIGNFTDTIHIRGVGINPVIEPKASVVDFGKIKLGLSKDTTVFIIENKSNQDINITNTSIIGPEMDQFEILSNDKAFTVPANQEKDLKLRFVAQYTGRVSTIIEFEYDDAIVPLRSMLFAEGISDVVQTITDTIDFGNVRIGNIKDTNAYLIKNLSGSLIDITDMQIVGPDLNQFSIQESGTDFSINGYDSLQVNLRFAVTNPGNTTTTIESYNYFTSTKLETVLLGNGVGGAIQPVMDDAYIGDNADLELHLDGINPTLLTNIATNFSATVSYNSTLLAPIDKSMSVQTIQDKSYIQITGQLSKDSQIAVIPMKVGLGTADRSGLVITEFQLYDADGDSVDYDIEPGVGEFNVLGICEEGGKRLLNPNSEVTTLKLLPNSTSTQTTAEVTLIESGETELSIFDLSGNKVQTVYSGTPNIGKKQISIDVSNLANGRYYIKLTTPTITITEILEVVR